MLTAKKLAGKGKDQPQARKVGLLKKEKELGGSVGRQEKIQIRNWGRKRTKEGGTGKGEAGMRKEKYRRADQQA